MLITIKSQSLASSIGYVVRIGILRARIDTTAGTSRVKESMRSLRRMSGECTTFIGRQFAPLKMLITISDDNERESFQYLQTRVLTATKDCVQIVRVHDSEDIADVMMRIDCVESLKCNGGPDLSPFC